MAKGGPPKARIQRERPLARDGRTSIRRPRKAVRDPLFKDNPFLPTPGDLVQVPLRDGAPVIRQMGSP